MAKAPTRLLFTADLSSQIEALKVAEGLAEKLARTSNPGSVIVVSDEHGNEIYKVTVPSKS
jgi:hypothetical protein